MSYDYIPQVVHSIIKILRSGFNTCSVRSVDQ